MELNDKAKVWLNLVRLELADAKVSTLGKLQSVFRSKSAPNPDQVLQGRRVAQYEFGTLIGVGTAGLVFELTDLSNPGERALAVKVLAKPEGAGATPEEAQLFSREVEIGKKLDHPSVVRTWEALETDSARFVVMERVEGTSFLSLLGQAWTVDRCLELFKPLVEALQYAHDQGVVHRDIKPENVMLTTSGEVKILDFGLASLKGSAEVTMTGQFKGTPMFSSPEQVKSSRQVAPACDQFSFALILFEALTGQFPYPVDPKMPLHTLFLRLQQPATTLRSVDPKFSEATEAVLARMLAMEPADRYPRIKEGFQALEDSF